MDDDGLIIYDSHAICAYICDKYSNSTTDSLYTKNLHERAQIEARLHFNSGYLFARFRFLFEPILYCGSYDVPIEKVEYMQKCWPILEGFLEQAQYLCGSELTIADYCCIATIRSMEKYAPLDPVKYPKSLAWINRIEQLPEYIALNGVGGPEFQNVIDNRIIANRALAGVF